MKIGICDDERFFHQEMVKLCKEFFNTYGIDCEVSSYFIGEEVIKDSTELQLLILDIEMDKMSGIEVKEFFEEHYKKTAILFLTSHREYKKCRVSEHSLAGTWGKSDE